MTPPSRFITEFATLSLLEVPNNNKVILLWRSENKPKRTPYVLCKRGFQGEGRRLLLVETTLEMTR